MMKVRILLNLGTAEFGENALPEGVHDVKDGLGELLIARKLAVAIDEPKPAEPKDEQKDEDKQTKPASSGRQKSK